MRECFATLLPVFAFLSFPSAVLAGNIATGATISNGLVEHGKATPVDAVVVMVSNAARLTRYHCSVTEEITYHSPRETTFASTDNNVRSSRALPYEVGWRRINL